MKIANMTVTMQEVAERQGWTEADLARLALAFLARRGEVEAFEGYVIRAAKNERASTTDR